MNNKQLKAGIVGLGRWGQILVKSINQSKSEHLKFTHSFTRTIDKAKSFCEECSLNICSSYENLIKNKDIDIVVLATPHTLHCQQIIKAAEAKKHIFVEKPFTLTLKDAVTSYHYAKKNKVEIGVGFNRRFLPSLNYLKEISNQASFGSKIHIEGNFSGPFGYDYNKEMWRGSLNENPSGGMAAMGIHLIDAMIAVLGPIEAVQCTSKNNILRKLDIDDTTSVQLWFTSGATGYLSTLMATAPLWRLHLFGSNAWIQMNGPSEIISSFINENTKTKLFSDTNIERLELESFAKSILSNISYPISEEQVLNGVSAFEAISKSIKENGSKVLVGEIK